MKKAGGPPDGVPSGMSFANENPGADTITFAAGLTGTLRLTLGQLPSITDNLTISGPGAASLTIDAHGASRVLQISAGATGP